MNADVAQMNVPRDRERLNRLSGAAIGAAQKVSSTLGCGFLEKVYENALCLELRKRGVGVHLLVEDSLIVEIKAVTSIERPHRQQCLNYLRPSNLTPGLMLNFGHAHLEVGRVVFHF